MFSESESKAGPGAKARVFPQASSSVVVSSDSEPERQSKAKHDVSTPGASLSRKKTKSQTSQTTIPHQAEVGRKKMKLVSKQSYPYLAFCFYYDQSVYCVIFVTGPTASKKPDSSPKETMTRLEESQNDREDRRSS